MTKPWSFVTVTVKTASGTHTVTCEKLIVADGVRSTLGKQLGRQWHRGTAYGVAARAYATSGRSADPWITPPANPPQPGSYHPTSRGYARGYLPALTAALNRA